MKDMFPGYFPAQFKLDDEWENAIVVVDTNIILNLYRYSKGTKKSFIDALDFLQEQLWLPYTVADEYLRNRVSTIWEQASKYEETAKAMEGLIEQFEKSHSHPFIHESSMKGLKKAFSKVNRELKKNETVQKKILSDDSIRDEMVKFFENRVGEKFSDKELEVIFKEGSNRYKDKIPPGYEDTKKGGNSERLVDLVSKYGDLIIWKEIIRKAENDSLNVIFVTDDAKEDWWLIEKGRTFGPRPELIEEFQNETSQKISLINAEKFLTEINKKQDKELDKQTVDEVRDVVNRITIGSLPSDVIRLNSVVAGMGINPIQESLDSSVYLRSFNEHLHSITGQEAINRVQDTVSEAAIAARLGISQDANMDRVLKYSNLIRQIADKKSSFSDNEDSDTDDK